jgi:uncharacterized protein
MNRSIPDLRSARILAGLALLAMSALIHGAAFDCAKAATPIEKMICADPELSSLDERLAEAYSARLAANRDGRDVKSRQSAWLREVRNQCRDKVCLKAAYEKRLAELSPPDSTARKIFRDRKLGISFSYGADRKAAKGCRGSPNCVALLAPGGSIDSYLLAFEVFGGPLEKVAVDQSVFVKKDGAWIARGRSAERPAEPISGKDWRGIQAVVDCGVSDPETGFHAEAGECLWAVLSNGRRSVVVDSQGLTGNDAASLETIRSFRFER